jgi:hypothetical protein
VAESRRFRGLVWRLAAPLFAPIWPTLRPGAAGRLVLPMGCAKGRSRSYADEPKRHVLSGFSWVFVGLHVGLFDLPDMEFGYTINNLRRNWRVCRVFLGGGRSSGSGLNRVMEKPSYGTPPRVGAWRPFWTPVGLQKPN